MWKESYVREPPLCECVRFSFAALFYEFNVLFLDPSRKIASLSLVGQHTMLCALRACMLPACVISTFLPISGGDRARRTMNPL